MPARRERRFPRWPRSDQRFFKASYAGKETTMRALGGAGCCRVATALSSGQECSHPWRRIECGKGRFLVSRANLLPLNGAPANRKPLANRHSPSYWRPSAHGTGVAVGGNETRRRGHLRRSKKPQTSSKDVTPTGTGGTASTIVGSL